MNDILQAIIVWRRERQTLSSRFGGYLTNVAPIRLAISGKWRCRFGFLGKQLNPNAMRFFIEQVDIIRLGFLLEK